MWPFRGRGKNSLCWIEKDDDDDDYVEDNDNNNDRKLSCGRYSGCLAYKIEWHFGEEIKSWSFGDKVVIGV